MIKLVVRYLYVLVALVLVASCSSTRKLEKTPMIGGLTGEAYMEKVIELSPSWKTVSGKVALTLNMEGQKDAKVSATLRLKRGESIQLLVAPLLGIEVARLEAPNGKAQGPSLDISGSLQAMTLIGNAAGNLLRGGKNRDLLDGGAGNDTLIGGAGNDFLVGDSGNDIFLIGGTDFGTDTYLGGEGADIIRLSADVTVSSLRLTANAVNGTETLSMYGYDIAGTAGNDAFDISGITNVTSYNWILMGDGLDRFVGHVGADAVNGGSGNDTLNGGAGADTLVGGVGNDTYVVGGQEYMPQDLVVVRALDAAGNPVSAEVNVYIATFNLYPDTLTGGAVHGTHQTFAPMAPPVPLGYLLTGRSPERRPVGAGQVIQHVQQHRITVHATGERLPHGRIVRVLAGRELRERQMLPHQDAHPSRDVRVESHALHDHRGVTGALCRVIGRERTFADIMQQSGQ